MSEVRLIDANALKANLPEPTTIKQNWVYRTLCDFIDNAPTVDVDEEFIDKIRATGNFKNGYQLAKNYYKRPQGEWIEKVERRGRFAGDKTVYSYTCPFCGVKEFKKYPFCHCGADMRKPNCVTCDHFGKCEGCEKGEEE